jgi:peptide deformylase
MKEGSNKKSPEYEIYINPKFDVIDGEVIDSEESCLSTPGLCGMVKRMKNIKVNYLDRNGVRQRKKLSGEQAVFFQHEHDHLEGIIWVDKQIDTRLMGYC